MLESASGGGGGFLLGGLLLGGCLLLWGRGSPSWVGLLPGGLLFWGLLFFGGLLIDGCLLPGGFPWWGSPSLGLLLGGLLLGGSPSWGVSFWGWASFLGGSPYWGCLLLGGVSLADLPVNRITHSCKNITLATTSLRLVIIVVTRMHFSRMHTGRLLTICWSLLPGGCLLWGVCSQGRGVCSWGVSVHVSQHALRQTPPLLTESQPPVKTLPFPNFIAAGNKLQVNYLSVTVVCP